MEIVTVTTSCDAPLDNKNKILTTKYSNHTKLKSKTFGQNHDGKIMENCFSDLPSASLLDLRAKFSGKKTVTESWETVHLVFIRAAHYSRVSSPGI
jgi:hypothetical protein